MKPANHLLLWPALAGLLFGLFVHASSAATRDTSPSAVASAAVHGAELGLLASASATETDAAMPTATAQPAPAAPAPAESPAEPAANDSSTTVAAAPPGEGKLIFVDPGHGGPEIGATHLNAAGVEDLIEKELNLAIGLKLAGMLRQDGYAVELSRSSDTRPVADGSLAADLQARADLANQAGADLFVSIHHNGNDNPAVRGTEVYYCSDRTFSDDNQRLASLLQQALVRNLQQAGYDTLDRGIKDDSVIGHIAVLAPYNQARASAMPGVLGEALFLSNDQDAAALGQSHIQDAIAHAYLEAINAYFAAAN